MRDREKTPLRRWALLAAGTLALLFAGIIYGWSILKAPLAGAFGWSAGQLAVNFTVMFCFFCAGGIGGSLLTRRTSPRTTLLAAALCVFAGFGLASCLSGRSLFALYLSYGVLCGLGIGMAYNAVISTVSRWFPDKPGVCSGVLMMGFGLSALVVGNAANRLLETPGIGWRAVYLGLGAATGAALLLAALLLRLPRETDGLPAPKAAPEGAAESGCTTRQMLSGGRFYLLFLYLVLTSMVGNSVLSFARDFALSLGAASRTAAALVGVCSVCNGAGRVLSGLLFDLLGRRRTMLLANILTILAPAAALLAARLGSPGTGAAALCLVGLSYGCCPTFVTAGTMELFGRRHYSLNFSLMNTNLLFASFSAAAAGALAARTGGYAGIFLLLTGCAAAALPLNLALNRSR